MGEALIRSRQSVCTTAVMSRCKGGRQAVVVECGEEGVYGRGAGENRRTHRAVLGRRGVGRAGTRGRCFEGGQVVGDGDTKHLIFAVHLQLNKVGLF